MTPENGMTRWARCGIERVTFPLGTPVLLPPRHPVHLTPLTQRPMLRPPSSNQSEENVQSNSGHTGRERERERESWAARQRLLLAVLQYLTTNGPTKWATIYLHFDPDGTGEIGGALRHLAWCHHISIDGTTARSLQEAPSNSRTKPRLVWQGSESALKRLLQILPSPFFHSREANFANLEAFPDFLW